MNISRPKLLVAESVGFSCAALARLREAMVVVDANLDRPGLLGAVRDADVLWVRLRHRIDREVFDAAPNLTAVVTNTTGLNHIDLEEAQRRFIRVISLRGEADFLKEIRATAELTVGIALALLRRIPDAHAHVLAGGWDRDVFKGNELHGKTAGIVGYGRLGRIVARYLGALGVEVLATDPCSAPEDADQGVLLVPLDQLLASSDIVSLHVVLDATTTGIIGRQQFARMKPRAWFINTARGELVDEAALIDALRSGRLAGAALDVLSGERPYGMSTHPLVRYAREHQNVLITPHIGGNTFESCESTERFLAERLLATLMTLREGRA